MKALVLLCAAVLSPLTLSSAAAAQPAAAPTSAPAAAAPAPAPAAAAPAPAPAAAAPAPAPAAAAPAPAAAPPPVAPTTADTGGAAVTTAAPTAAPTSAAADMAPVAPTIEGETPIALKHTCMDAINSDQQWTNELMAQVQKKMRYDAHNSEAQLIAMNKRHVVLAYSALWLIAVGFLFMQWRRQQGLKRQIESLTRELENAIKEPAK